MTEAGNAARLPDTGWGDRNFTAHVAGMSFRFSGLSESQRRALGDTYGDQNMGNPGDAETLETRVTKQTLPKVGADKFVRNGIYTPIMSKVRSGLKIQGLQFQAVIKTDPFLHGELIAEDPELLCTPIIIENYLRILAAYAVLMRGGLLLHSSGVLYQGRAYLFVGHSGAGKTTLSRMALHEHAGILSDDINVVLPLPDGGFAASAVPFAGELGHRCLEPGGSYPLAGIFWLCKNNSARVGPLTDADQLAKLVSCCPGVNGDAGEFDRLLSVASNLLKLYSMKSLCFSKNDTFSTLRELIQDQAGVGPTGVVALGTAVGHVDRAGC